MCICLSVGVFYAILFFRCHTSLIDRCCSCLCQGSYGTVDWDEACRYAQLRLNLAGYVNLKSARERGWYVTPKSNSGNLCKVRISKKPIQTLRVFIMAGVNGDIF